MTETNDPNQLMDVAPDTAPLAWVIDEIRTSLGQAVNGIKTFLGSKQDLDSLRNAAGQVHQANGALQLLDMRGVALVTEALEHLFRKWENDPKECGPSAVRSVETAASAILAYLEGVLQGRPNQPIRLFPYYRDILTLNQAPRVHPADLVFPDLTRRPAFHRMESRPLTSDQLRVRRVRFEEGLLGFLRDVDNARARAQMRDALADIEQLPLRGLTRSFWWVVRGLLEAIAARQLTVDTDLKRVLARLNLQLRRLIDGGAAVAERLMIDTLYYVGRADDGVPRVAEVKRLYGLSALIAPDFERATLTTLDAEAMRLIKEALTQAKTLWGQIVGAAAASNDGAKFSAEINQARSAAARLDAKAIDKVLETIGGVTQEYGRLATSVRDTLGLEVASALLFLEIGVEHLPQTDDEYAQRAEAVIGRLQAAYAGNALPDSAPWMSDLARKAQDRLTMGTVVVETQAQLRDIEQRLDRFFRNPAERGELEATAPMFDQVCGVLSVLGADEPVAALRSVQASVRAFADPKAPAQPEEFARIAGNLGAVGFFIESMGQDIDRPRGMFHFDPATGVFSADLTQQPASAAVDADDTITARIPEPRAGDTRRPENIETSAAQHLELAQAMAERLVLNNGDSAALEGLSRLLPQMANEADLLDDAKLKDRIARAAVLLTQFAALREPSVARDLASLLAPQAAPDVPAPTAPLPETDAAADRELHDIFVEEANEVLETIETQLVALRKSPDDNSTLTTVRRAFHTLKGSSRMVGLKQFGEGAWAIEQCFNLWLAQERAANDDLIELAATAHRLMREWITAMATNPRAPVDVHELVAAAQRVREGAPFEYGSSAPPKSQGSGATSDAPATLPAGVEGAEHTAIPAPTLIAPTIVTPAPEIVAPAVTTPATRLPRVTPAVAEHAPAPLAPIEPVVASLPVVEEQAIEVQELAPVPDVPELDVPVLEEAVLEEPALDVPVLEERVEVAMPATAAPEAVSTDESIKRIGPVEISHGLYSVFLNEADESIRTLAQDIAEWRFEPTRAVLPATVRRAHSLAGISATVGLTPVWAIADGLDDLMHELGRRGDLAPPVLSAGQFDALEQSVERMRAMLHQFAAGIYPSDAPRDAAAVQEVLRAIRDVSTRRSHAEPTLVRTEEARPPAAPEVPAADDGLGAPSAAGAIAVEEIDVTPPRQPVAKAPRAATADEQAEEWLARETAAKPATPPVAVLPETTEDEPKAFVSTVRDELDPDLLPVFLAEAHDLLPAIGGGLRALAANPNDRSVARELMRQMHTAKGSARMAGAMRLGELVHEMETRIEAAMQLVNVPHVIIEDLQSQYDHAMALYERLQHPGAEPEPAAPQETKAPASQPVQPAAPLAPVINLASVRNDAKGEPAREVAAPPAAAPLVAPAQPATAAQAAAQPASFIRVRADVLDKLVDQAGEVSIARAKLENEVGTLKGALLDLTENIGRLRTQLREVEIQADAQIQARADQLAKESAAFDPLEFDRYTRLQELTRLLAESVEDVAMVQSNMLKGLQSADQDLTSQSRLTRDLQQQLMRVRLVPFSNIAERLYRVARQAAKELDKRVNLEIRGGTTEIDRGVLERMSGPFEHLVRNAIVHGLEMPAQRASAGKREVGELAIEVRQEGNEIIVVVSDDGAGLALDRIRARGVERGLIGRHQVVSDRELMELIFAPGFSTAAEVTELAGRGVGMDVVRSELSSFGGRVAVATEATRGTRFTLYLPLTLAVTQVVLATIGGRRYAIPAGMVEQVRRYKPTQMLPALAEGQITLAPIGDVVLRPLAQLLGEEIVPHLSKQTPVVLLRSGDDRLAIAVDEISTNQEVVVKNVGQQIARLAGILGATILGNGEIVLIINPVQLIARAPEPHASYTAPEAANDEARRARERLEAANAGANAPAVIMVVDDSLTVRRVTQRLLERNGYEVLLAKDGVDALRQLQDTRPDIMLVDIEMPRMDGFDLTRNIRGASSTRDIPIIMITSRTAEKHRSLAFEIGVNEYLGKPYQEEELLAHIKRLLAAPVTA
ncbi:MAG TPA: Hpt domain-containing protein [Burkholderiaceae bacterium]|nr:Hpt domain-containing protein [Burkholderiaceae bacterium]